MPDPDPIVLAVQPAAFEVRDAARREIIGRVVPYGVTTDVAGGRERMDPGVFAGTVPDGVRLRWEHRETIGRSVSFEERDDGLYGTFFVPRTDLGDRALTLAAEGIVDGLSVGFVPDQYRTETDGTRVHTRARLVEVSVVTFPAYAGAAVAAIRSEEGNPEDSDRRSLDADPEEVAMTDNETPDLSVEVLELREAVRRLETAPPSPVPAPTSRSLSDLSPVLYRAAARLLGDGAAVARADRVLETRALSDVTTTDVAGLIPTAYQREVLEVVEPFRPFASSVRQVSAPSAGTTIAYPRVTGKPSVAVQSAEKAETDAGKLTVEFENYAMTTLTAASDLSLQAIVRSDPSTLDLFLRALLESYGFECDLAGLLAFGVPGPSGPIAGGTIDPGDSSSWVGASWENAYAGTRKAPDTIWMTPAVAAGFVNAVDGDGRPLYPTLNPQNAGGIANVSQTSPIGSLHGLRAIVVPAMADTNVPFSAIVGPSSEYGFAEDGTYTLQADVPGRAGRDVGLAGMVWLMPFHVRGFTAWQYGVTAAASTSKAKG